MNYIYSGDDSRCWIRWRETDNRRGFNPLAEPAPTDSPPLAGESGTGTPRFRVVDLARGERGPPEFFGLHRRLPGLDDFGKTQRR